MLSILIPVYNFDVTDLVKNLHKQAINTKKAFEIILIDDGSSQEFRTINKKINLENLRYIEESVNIGRSKIRNKLAEYSSYPYLLFMDCDSKVTSDNYIAGFLKYCHQDIVVCGGRTYDPEKPIDPDLYLRWKHGTAKEVFSVETRNKFPNRSFMANNFLISKYLFNKIKFDEDIEGYGHEDTLFGFELKKLKIKVIHIDNPLIHIGLENNLSFIEKTREGIKNLKYISGINAHASILEEDIKLLRYYKLLERNHLKNLVAYLFKKSEDNLKRNLCGKYPNLFLFDLYKLGYMCTLD